MISSNIREKGRKEGREEGKKGERRMEASNTERKTARVGMQPAAARELRERDKSRN